MSQVFKVDVKATEADIKLAVDAAISCVQAGGLAVIPTDTSYAFICDAFNVSAM